MDKELKACSLPFCGGPVQFHKDDDCAGCHLIECQSCKTLFDLATKADPYNQAGSVEELQRGIAYLWNLPTPSHQVAEPGAAQEIQWLEQWLLLAAEPIGQECCGQAYLECCGNAEPVYRTADEIAVAMNARREELRALLAKP